MARTYLWMSIYTCSCIRPPITSQAQRGQGVQTYQMVNFPQVMCGKGNWDPLAQAPQGCHIQSSLLHQQLLHIYHTYPILLESCNRASHVGCKHPCIRRAQRRLKQTCTVMLRAAKRTTPAMPPAKALARELRQHDCQQRALVAAHQVVSHTVACRGTRPSVNSGLKLKGE